MQQALDRAVANGVKNLVVQPTHLMHGAEYDEMMEMIDEYKDKFESVAVAEPLLASWCRRCRHQRRQGSCCQGRYRCRCEGCGFRQPGCRC